MLLVDAPALSRRCLAFLLNHRRRLQVVGQAAHGTEAITLAHALQPDVIVVEPEVPEGGLKLVEELGRAVPGGAVLVLTVGVEMEAVSRALQLGARGYLHKDCEPEDLVRMVERVHAGELVVAATVSDLAVRDSQSGAAREPGPGNLTERELAVLRLVAQGRTNPEIARDLYISEHTVKGHLNKILSKLGLENRVQLASYATQHGLAAPLQRSEAASGTPLCPPPIG